MRMDELKRGFWGYTRDSVYRYIVLLEEEASKRAAEKDARLDKQEAESRQQIAGLEAMIAALREENRTLRDNQELVFSTMLEAQKYADQLKADSLRQARQAQEELSGAIAQQNQQLGGYAKRVRELRDVIRELLEEFDARAEEAEKAAERLPSTAPGVDPDRRGGEGRSFSGDAPAAGAETAGPDREKGEEWNKLLFI